MLAAKLTRPRTLVVEELEDPAPRPGEDVEIRVLAVGICGSDMHMYSTGSIGGIPVERPLVLGHEFSGEIVALRGRCRDANGTELQVGQRVAVDPHVACGGCEWCLQGRPNLCPNHYFYGVFPTHGALRERLWVPGRCCYRVPDGLSSTAAALLEPLGVALHALDLAAPPIGGSAAVLGCGPIGLMIARLCVLSGARVFASEPLPWRRHRAAGLGAEVNNAGEVVDWIAGETGGKGVDVAYEVAWAGSSLEDAVEVAKPGAEVVVVGISADDRLSLSHSVTRRKGLTIRLARRMRHTYARAIELACRTEAGLDLDAWVSHRYQLADTGSAFALNEAYSDGVIKIVIEPTG